MAVKINIRTLLEAGCHYGHQTRRWNPKMREYIFGDRNGIYILDLKKTVLGADRAYSFLKDIASKGGKLLFRSTTMRRSIINIMPALTVLIPKRMRMTDVAE